MEQKVLYRLLLMGAPIATGQFLDLREWSYDHGRKKALSVEKQERH